MKYHAFHARQSAVEQARQAARLGEIAAHAAHVADHPPSKQQVADAEFVLASEIRKLPEVDLFRSAV